MREREIGREKERGGVLRPWGAHGLGAVSGGSGPGAARKERGRGVG